MRVWTRCARSMASTRCSWGQASWHTPMPNTRATGGICRSGSMRSCRARRMLASPHKGSVTTMIIPHLMRSPEALRGVIEAFVTREGTDYGVHDVPLATKVGQVRHQLDTGTAVIVYDENTESWTVQST